MENDKSKNENLAKISVYDLKLGMYVSRLDRPWIETPFLFQGVKVDHAKDIAALQKYCEYVYIDTELGLGLEDNRYLTLQPARPEEDKHADIFRVPTGFSEYPQQTSFQDEFKDAKIKHHDAISVVKDIVDDIKNSRKLYLTPVRNAVSGIIDSVIRNPDASLWLTRLKSKDEYTYTHSVDACSLAVAFGRHLGLPKNELDTLAIGTLLIDVGKLQLPTDLLTKSERLSDKEVKLFQYHVKFGIQMLREMQGINDDIISIVQNHHERYNGSGYPRKLKGAKIPIFARIAAIVDCYDAITSERTYAKAISSYEAIHLLYEWRNQDFQSDIIEQFIQCLGVFPTGTIVELTTGEIGIVYAQNRIRRLRPKVMLVLDKNKQSLEFNPTLDLIQDPLDEENNPIEIVKGHNPGSFGIELKDYYF